MNLVQKLPIGLGLACLMFISSCSEEDAATPESVTNESSNLRQGGLVITSVYHLPSTEGPTCVGCEPAGWKFDKPGQDATSSLIAYGGHPLKKWSKPLATPSTGSGSIITITSKGYKHGGGAKAQIKNLIKGKKYKLTASVSTTSLYGDNGPYSYVASLAVMDGPLDVLGYKQVHFPGKQNQWITETVEFVAWSTEQTLRIYSYGEDQNNLAYTNFHVGPNAVQQID